MGGWVAGWVAGWGNQWMTDGRLGRTHPGPTQCILPLHVPLWFSRQIMAPGRSLLSLWPAAGSTAWPPEPLSRCCPITARLSVPRELVLPGAPPHLPSIRPHLCSLLDASPIVTSVTPRTVCPPGPASAPGLPVCPRRPSETAEAPLPGGPGPGASGRVWRLWPLWAPSPGNV